MPMLGATETDHRGQEAGQEAVLTPLNCATTRNVPYFWGVLDKTSLNPYSCQIPANRVSDTQEITDILRLNTQNQPIEGIDLIVEKERENPSRSRDPTIMIEHYTLHMRVRLEGGSDELFTLDRRLADVYLKKAFYPGFVVDPVPTGRTEPDAAYPSLCRLRQRVRDHALNPNDIYAQIKIMQVIMYNVQKVIEQLGEIDLSRCSLHIFEKDQQPQKIDLSRQAIEDTARAAEAIGFRPDQYRPEQIF